MTISQTVSTYPYPVNALLELFPWLNDIVFVNTVTFVFVVVVVAWQARGSHNELMQPNYQKKQITKFKKTAVLLGWLYYSESFDAVPESASLESTEPKDGSQAQQQNQNAFSVAPTPGKEITPGPTPIVEPLPAHTPVTSPPALPPAAPTPGETAASASSPEVPTPPSSPAPSPEVPTAGEAATPVPSKEAAPTPEAPSPEVPTAGEAATSATTSAAATPGGEILPAAATGVEMCVVPNVFLNNRIKAPPSEVCAFNYEQAGETLLHDLASGFDPAVWPTKNLVVVSNDSNRIKTDLTDIELSNLLGVSKNITFGKKRKPNAHKTKAKLDLLNPQYKSNFYAEFFYKLQDFLDAQNLDKMSYLGFDFVGRKVLFIALYLYGWYMAENWRDLGLRQQKTFNTFIKFMYHEETSNFMTRLVTKILTKKHLYFNTTHFKNAFLKFQEANIDMGCDKMTKVLYNKPILLNISKMLLAVFNYNVWHFEFSIYEKQAFLKSCIQQTIYSKSYDETNKLMEPISKAPGGVSFEAYIKPKGDDMVLYTSAQATRDKKTRKGTKTLDRVESFNNLFKSAYEERQQAKNNLKTKEGLL